MTDYPSATDYMRAVQNPQEAFRDPLLQKATFLGRHQYGIPRPVRGSYAVVFHASVGTQERALRFFIQEAGEPDRYRALERYITAADLRANVAPASWTDNAILVNERRWPMVNTEWVEGKALDTYVETLACQRDTQKLARLSDQWLDLIRRLQNARFAHGDMQHGNVLVDRAGSLRLVDLDSAWIAEFVRQRAPKVVAHKNYQLKGHPWGLWMDTFPGLVIYTGLLGLARSPSVWTKELTADKIVFSAADFVEPCTSDTWRRLESIGDPQLNRALTVLKSCCRPGWVAQCSLEDLLAEVPRRGSGAQVPDGTEHWWEQTGPPSVTTPPAAARTIPAETSVRNIEPFGIDEEIVPDKNWHKKLPQPEPREQPTPPQPVPPQTGQPDTADKRIHWSDLPVALLVGVMLGTLLAGVLIPLGVDSGDVGWFGVLTTLASTWATMALVRR
jgi:eukaryotic-like serine/threonine-protein kinase